MSDSSFTDTLTLGATLAPLYNSPKGFSGSLTSPTTNTTNISLVGRTGNAITMIPGASIDVTAVDLSGFQASGNGQVLYVIGRTSLGWNA